MPLALLTGRLLGHPHEVLDIGLRWLGWFLNNDWCLSSLSLLLCFGLFSLKESGLLSCSALCLLLFFGDPGSFQGGKSFSLSFFSLTFLKCGLLGCTPLSFGFLLSLTLFKRGLLGRKSFGFGLLSLAFLECRLFLSESLGLGLFSLALLESSLLSCDSLFFFFG